MSRSAEIFTVFISSPSEVMDERDGVSKAISIVNRMRGKQDGFRLEELRWENDITPDMGQEPQAIIDAATSGRYDIFVGVLCSRFGTQTNHYGSGTEQEFEIALARRLKTQRDPHILTYFKDPREAKIDIDAEQLLKVQEFRKRIGANGIYHMFRSTDEFITALAQHLSDAVNALRAGSQDASPDRASIDAIVPQGSIEAYDDDQDLGLLEYSELAEESFEAANIRMSIMTDGQKSFSDRLKSHTEESKRLVALYGRGSVPRVKSRTILGLSAQTLDQYAQSNDASTPQLEEDFARALDAMRKAMIIITEDTAPDLEEVRRFGDINQSFGKSIGQARVGAQELASTIAKLPRMTSEVNRSKRRAVDSIGRLDTVFADCLRQVDLIGDVVDRYLADKP